MQPRGPEDCIIRSLRSDDGELDYARYPAGVDWEFDCPDHCFGSPIESFEGARRRLHIAQVDSHLIECISKDQID